MNSKTLYAAVLAAAIGGAAMAQTPVLLKNFNTRPANNSGSSYNSSYSPWAQLGTRGFMQLQSYSTGTELWYYDTNTSTMTCATEGRWPGDPTHIGNPNLQLDYNGLVYFTAYDNNTGNELYQTDGTASGTSMVADIKTGNPVGYPDNSERPNGFIVFNNVMYFTADDGVNGRHLWRYDTVTGSNPPSIVDIAADTVQPTPKYTQVPGALFYASGTGLYRLIQGTPDTITNLNAAGLYSINAYSGLGVMGTDLFFAASATDPNDVVGEELYKADNGGTISLVWDILPTASESSRPQRFATSSTNGRLYFTANGAVGWPVDDEPHEFYYDYTDPNNPVAMGARFDVNQTVNGSNLPNGSSPGSTSNGYFEVNGSMLFSANDGLNGTELWVIPSTGIASTSMIEKNDGGLPGGLYNGSGSGFPSSNGFVLTDPLTKTKAIFRGNSSVSGAELWETDGTATGTNLVVDFSPGSGSTTLGFQDDGTDIYRGAMGGGIILLRADNKNGWSLEPAIYTEGTPSTLSHIADIKWVEGAEQKYGGFSNAEGVVNTAYGVGMFVANTEDPNLGPLGNELWRTDGTPAGTVFVRDIQPGTGSSSPGQFCQAGTLMYFRANEGSAAGKGTEPYFSNAVPAGLPGASFANVGDLVAGTGSSYPTQLTYMGKGKVLFNATSDGGAIGGWSGTNAIPQLHWMAGAGNWGRIDWYDTSGGGAPVATPVISPVNMVYRNSKVYMGGISYYDYTNGSSYEIFSCNGNTAEKLTDMAFQGEAGVLLFDDANDLVYFTGNYIDTLGANVPTDTNFGLQLWVISSDWDINNLVRLTNEVGLVQYGQVIGAAPSLMTAYAGKNFFSGLSDTYGQELWVTDGTVTGTSVFKDINPGPADSGFSQPVEIAAGLVFAANDGTHGTEMWLCDGTVTGTNMIVDHFPGGYPGGDGAPSWITKMGSRRVAYRAGKYTTYGSEMYSCDGTSVTRLSDINPNYGDAFPLSWTLQSGLLMFEATHWQTGEEGYTTNFGANALEYGITSGKPIHTEHCYLTATDPVMGQPFTFSGTGAIPGTPVYLAFSFPAGEIVFQGLSVYVDLLGSWWIVSQTPPNGQPDGTFTFLPMQWAVNPAYAGIDLVYQALSVSPAGLFKSRVTNAVFMNVDLN